MYPTAIGSEPDHPDFDTEPLWEQVIRATASRTARSWSCPIASAPKGPVTFYGSSFVSDPTAACSCRRRATSPAVLVADLDLDQRRDWLELFPFLATRRPDTYGSLTEGR